MASRAPSGPRAVVWRPLIYQPTLQRQTWWPYKAVRMCLVCSKRKLYHKKRIFKCSSYGSRRFHTCDHRAPTDVFSTQICFLSRPGRLGLIVKNRVKSVFFDVIKSSATSMCSIIYRLLYISVCMRTSSEKVRISDEAERVQSVSYPYIQWRLVVKLAGRAAKFHLWLNIWDCRPGCFYNIVVFPVTPAVLVLSNS